MRIDPGDDLAGVPIVAVRDFMRRFVPGAFMFEAVLRRLDLSDSQARALVAELQRRGYVEPSTSPENAWNITLEGSGFAMASAAPAVTRGTAERNLEAFLKRVAEVNDDPDLLHWVSEAWLFGSMLDEARDRVSDVDLAVRLVRRIESPNEYIQATKDFADRQQDEGRHFQNYGEYLMSPVFEIYRRLKARSRVLSIHDADTDEGFQRSESRLLYQFDPPGGS